MFQVELQGLPDDLEGELETLDSGIAHKLAFRLGNRVGKALCAACDLGQSLDESFPAHGAPVLLSGNVKKCARLCEKKVSQFVRTNPPDGIVSTLTPPTLPCVKATAHYREGRNSPLKKSPTAAG
jgi:hypothetical protein